VALMMAWMAMLAPWQMARADSPRSNTPCHMAEHEGEGSAEPSCDMGCCDQAQCTPDCPFMLAFLLPTALLIGTLEHVPGSGVFRTRGMSRLVFPELRPPIA
jgi:hypothetical protein